MKKADLLGYAHAYVSFVLPRVSAYVKEIILFGSVARGDFEAIDFLLFGGRIADRQGKLHISFYLFSQPLPVFAPAELFVQF